MPDRAVMDAIPLPDGITVTRDDFAHGGIHWVILDRQTGYWDKFILNPSDYETTWTPPRRRWYRWVGNPLGAAFDVADDALRSRMRVTDWEAFARDAARQGEAAISRLLTLRGTTTAAQPQSPSSAPAPDPSRSGSQQGNK